MIKKYVLTISIIILFQTIILSQGYSVLSIPSNDSVTIKIPPGMQLVFNYAGSWNPDLKEAQGYDSTYISGEGMDVIRIGTDTNYVGVGDYCKKFKAQNLSFFSLIWSDQYLANYKKISSIEWASNSGSTDRVLVFQMNDEQGEYYNNKGDMKLIYFLRPNNGYPWALWNNWPDTCEIPKNTLNNEIAISHPSIKNIKYYSMIEGYNSFAKMYRYFLYLHNSGSVKVKLKITIDDNGKNIITYKTLNPNEYAKDWWFVSALNQRKIKIEKI